MQDSRGAKRAEGETLHPQQPSVNPAKKIKPRTSPAAPDAAAVAQPPAAVSPTDTTNNSAPPYPWLLAALNRARQGHRGFYLPECEPREFRLRLCEMEKINEFWLRMPEHYNPICTSRHRREIAGGNYHLGPEMVKIIKNLESTK